VTKFGRGEMGVTPILPPEFDGGTRANPDGDFPDWRELEADCRG
jgi:hypothetical protein